MSEEKTYGSLEFLRGVDFATLSSFNQSRFSLEERADSWKIRGINGILVYLSKDQLPGGARTQDEYAEHRRIVIESGSDEFYCPTSPEMDLIVSALYKNKDNPRYQKEVERAKLSLKNIVLKHYLATLTRIQYNPEGNDVIIHNYKQPDEHKIEVNNFTGPNRYILSQETTNAKAPLQALLDTKDSLEEINERYKWLTSADSYVIRLNSRPEEQDEKVARFFAYSDGALLSCYGDPLGSNASLWVKFYHGVALKIKL